MKKLITICLSLFITCIISAQQTSYPFEVSVTGDAEQTLILIPGFASSGDVWNETIEKFQSEFTLHTLTMAGFAGAKPHETKTFEFWKESIAAYITDKNITQPILMGHSMGGGLAMAIAADYPYLIQKIIVVDALPCLAALQNPTFEAQENIDCSSSITYFVEMEDEPFQQMQKSTMVQLTTDESKRDELVKWSINSDRETFAKMYCDFSNTDLRDKISSITCPSLILMESYFVNFESSISEQFKNLKTANIQYADKGLHFIMYDDKEWYFNQLGNYLLNQ